jgi:hypothetical protein
MKKIIFALVFSLFSMCVFAQKPSVSNYYINGDLVISSQNKNATVQAITPEIRSGKDIRIFVQTSNYSNEDYIYNPTIQTMIKITYKNGKTAIVKPTNPDEYIRKIYNNYVLAEAIGGFSSGYSNSVAGNRTATYQTDTRGTVSGNISSINYNQTQTGVIQYYDQNEVNRRNEVDRQNMMNRANRFNSSLSSLNESMMRTNTIKPNQTEAGYVVFKAKGKNIQSLELTVSFGYQYHVLAF